MSKMGKELKKCLQEAIETTKCAPEYSPDGRKNYHFCGNKGWPTFDEMIADWDREKKEKWKKMTPEQRKKEKAKEKAMAQREKIKEQKRQEKYAKQRAKNGFCDEDTWSVDWWFCRVVPKILRQLATNMHGWQPKLGYIYNSKTKKIEKTKKDITFKDHQKVVFILADMIEAIIVEDPDDKRWNNKKLGYCGDYNEKLKNEALDIFKGVFFSLWD